MRFLTFLLLFILASCSDNNSPSENVSSEQSMENASNEQENTSTTEVSGMNNASGHSLTIAYYSLDTLKLNFKYYKEQDRIVSQKQLVFQNEIERRTKALQNFVMQKEKEAQNGALSENQLIEIQQQIQKKQEAILQYEQSQSAQIEKEMAQQLEKIDRKIELVGRRFSELNQIDILISSGRGGQFNYIHPRYNVTEKFIQFLNENEKDF